MSPEHSEIRKSLESIQSMLSRGGDDHQRSSTTASSLSSRVHRSSAEAGEGGSAGGGRSASSVSFGGARIASDDDAGGASSSVIRRSHSSAFSAVNKFMTIGGGGGVLSPSPFNGDERTGGLGVAPRSSAAWGGRETSLLVSPVSRRSSGGGEGASPASDAGAINDAAFASAAGGAAHRYCGPTGTPMTIGTRSFFGHDAAAMAGSAGAAGGAPENVGDTPPGSTTTRPRYAGIDPTPYRGGDDDRKHSESSSRSGLDPPAKSPMPIGTPNVQSHHFRNGNGSGGGGGGGGSDDQIHQRRQLHFAAEEQNELSMIDEDESSTAGQSLASNVTGSTFVRTPVFYKRAGAGRHDSNNPLAAAVAATPGSYSTASSSATHAAATPSTSARPPHHHPRPSLAMRESLDRLAVATGRALEGVWDDVGVAPDERASHLADLVEGIGRLCEAKVREEEALRDQFRKEIADARREHGAICSALRLEGEEDPVARVRRDPSAGDPGGGVSLQWEYEAMMGRLESLRSVRDCATADILASRSRIHEAYVALSGCTLEEASRAAEMRPFSDVETDLTLERREEFRNGARQYEEGVSTRVRAVVTLLFDCQSMIRELEISPGDEFRVGRSVDDFRIMNSLQPIDGISTENEGGGVRGGAGRGESSNYTITSLFESDSCIGVANSALDRLTSRIAELNGEKRRRRAKLGEMGQAISTLWTMLRVSAEEQRTFTTSIRGLGLDTIRKGEAEIARLEELKRATIGQLVRDQRSDIEELWRKTNSSAAECASFDAYFRIQDDGQLTSEVLAKHEDYAASLKAKLRRMQPILDLIAKRESIIEERIELELLQKDPDRLKGRGATKQLMKEEKMNRRVTKELPKITSILEETLRQWYVENKPDAEEGQAMVESDLGHFMYQGSPYLQTIQWQEEEWRTRKERSEEERHRKRQEDRNASSAANAPFGQNAYAKLSGKTNLAVATSAAAAPTSTRPRSASTLRSESNLRSGSNAQSGGSHPSDNGNNAPRSGSNLRFGGRGPLGDVSSSRQNASRPPAPPKHGAGVAPVGGADRSKKAAGGRGYRPASAPRMRL